MIQSKKQSQQKHKQTARRKKNGRTKIQWINEEKWLCLSRMKRMRWLMNVSAWGISETLVDRLTEALSPFLTILKESGRGRVRNGSRNQAERDETDDDGHEPPVTWFCDNAADNFTSEREWCLSDRSARQTQDEPDECLFVDGEKEWHIETKERMKKRIWDMRKSLTRILQESPKWGWDTEKREKSIFLLSCPQGPSSFPSLSFRFDFRTVFPSWRLGCRALWIRSSVCLSGRCCPGRWSAGRIEGRSRGSQEAPAHPSHSRAGNRKFQPNDKKNKTQREECNKQETTRRINRWDECGQRENITELHIQPQNQHHCAILQPQDSEESHDMESEHCITIWSRERTKTTTRSQQNSNTRTKNTKTNRRKPSHACAYVIFVRLPIPVPWPMKR